MSQTAAMRAAARCWLRSGDEGEAGLADALVFDLFDEHGTGADPEGAVAVELAIDDELFLSLGVAGDLEHAVLVAFVVAVATGLRLEWSSEHRGVRWVYVLTSARA
jgi:hypothetical protein